MTLAFKAGVEVSAYNTSTPEAEADELLRGETLSQKKVPFPSCNWFRDQAKLTSFRHSG